MTRPRAVVFAAATAAALATGALAVRDPVQFFRSYLLGYFFWFGIAIGSLALLMLHHLVGGRWGYLIRRPLEAASGTLPLLAALFLPIYLGRNELYVWANPGDLTHHTHLEHIRPYLNPTAFLLRAAVAFVLWIGMAALLRRWSDRQDHDSGPALLDRLKAVSGPGLVLLVFTSSFAFFDWVMSIEPFWYSTVYGLMVLSGHGLASFAFMTLVAYARRDHPGVRPLLERAPFYDLGNLMLAFVLLWSYLSFSQYLLVWSGNLVEEIPWYLRRTENGWLSVVVILAALHFALPFFILLVRDVKRRPERLACVAGLIVVMRLVDLFWLIAPAFHGTVRIDALDLLVPLALGAIWFGVFWRLLAHRPPVPERDPRFREVLVHE